MSDYRCTNCAESTRSSLDVARNIGWRIWDGQSVTGKALAVRLCPACVNGPDAAPPRPSWRVGCHTCDWEWEDEDDEGPLSEKDAKDMAMDHECEPDVWVKSPQETPAPAPAPPLAELLVSAHA